MFYSISPVRSLGCDVSMNGESRKQDVRMHELGLTPGRK
jgi:hypothetical protein